ncbi:MAG: LysM peptidoglycan-binding domain-containing protein [Bdellovibrionaceae bacterium]|nr:LysM peptidoglycan-binding domain-containing protein [Pseudobdellovibrionaceae bacterium]
MWMKFAPVIVVLVGTGPSAFAQEGADARKEQRLHQIYRNYYANPTSPEKWSEALGRAKDQTYTIQKGDTLWGISETFFGDPNFWPKIWSLNTDIYNPHEIAPSGVVSFQLGTAAEPPSLAVGNAPATPQADPPVDPNAAPAAPAKPVIGQYIDIDLGQLKIPPPSRSQAPPRSFPRSIPGYVYHRDPKKSALLELSTVTRAPTDNVPLSVNHFVSDTEVQGAGEVLGSELGFSTAGEGQTILIKGSGLSQGMRLMSVRRQGPVRGAPEALAYGIGGMLEVEAPVNSAEGVYRARVVKSVSHVSRGDILVSEELPSMVPAGGGSMSPVNGKIIGGEFSAERRLFGMYNIVYLNAGSNQGLAVGTHVPVYRNPSLRNADLLIRENPAEIGELQVVRVGGRVSTAIVVKSLEDIRVGDTTTPAMLTE